jgi:hypothetical protein
VPFTKLGLHPSLLQGLKDLGFTRPTPIQADAIPLAMAGQDLLACAMTGSGKTAAFLLPILHRLIDKPRGTTRALVLTPTRELAAQIAEDLNDLAVHTPLTAAAIFGGVGMGPQEHAFRSGVDVIVATPGRLLDHFRQPYAALAGLEVLVLDEADRMLDMGFLPDIRRILKHLPPRRQTLFFSATMPAPIVTLSREMLHNPATVNLGRQSAPAVGITQAVYPVAQELKSALLVTLLERGEKMVADHDGSAAELIRDLVHGWWESIGLTPFAGLPKLMISECRNFPELGKFYVDEVMARGHKLVRRAVQRGLDSGEFRDLDPEYVSRLIFAPLVLMVVWRYSFDFCSATNLEPGSYIDQHLDILLRGLLAPSRGRLRAVRPAART